MSKRTLAAGLMFMMALAACNLANAPGQGGGQTAISGAPVVRIAAPLPNATYLEGVSVNIQAAISNAGADIDRVEIAVDEQIAATLPKPNTAGTPTFSIAQTWTAAGAGQHTIAVTAFRADGSSSAPTSVNVTVVAQGAQTSPTPKTATTTTSGSNSQSSSTGSNNQVPATLASTATPAPPTNTPQPEATNTPTTPQVSFTQGVNLRRGPSTKFAPPIGSYAAGQTANILAKTPAGDWYKISGTNGEGWVSATFVTVSGDESQIRIDAGPPVPTDTPAFTATPPPTAVPQTTANLVLGNVTFNPALPAKCGKTMEIKVDVANLGQQATSAGGTISIRDIYIPTNTETQSTSGAFPVIDAGKTVNIGGMFLTVPSYGINEDHKIVVVVNPNGAVPETNNTDNSRELTYKLQSC